MTNSQSKDAFVNDTEAEDLMFIDEEGGQLRLVDEDIICECCDEEVVDDDGKPDYSIIINIMKDRYFWYMGEKSFRGELSWMKVLKKSIKAVNCQDENILARHLYKEMDYPTMRDAKCPYKCEGCQVKKQCMYCADCVSICQATTNTVGKETIFFCDDLCFKTYFTGLYTGHINQKIEYVNEKIKLRQQELTGMELELRSNKKILHMKTMEMYGKSTILRSELVKVQTRIQYELIHKQNELQCFQSLLDKQLPIFETMFAKIQEYYVDKLEDADDDKDLMDTAKGTKCNINQLKSFANILLGTKYEL